MQSYTSNELTHFVGRSLRDDEERYALLLDVLRSGILLDPRYQTKRDTPIFFFDVVSREGGERRQNYYPNPYFEVRENGPVAANEFVMPEMVCFCDIPLKELTIHTAKYSRFGLAFSKAFLVTKGANPVHYIAQDAATPLQLSGRGGEVHPDFFKRDEENGLLSAGQGRAEFLEKLKLRTLDLIERYSGGLQERFTSYERGRDDPREARAQLLSVVEFMMGTFCYVHGLTKVFDPALADNDPGNFYMEREWRVIGSVVFKTAEVSRVLVPQGFGERFRRDEPAFDGEVTEL
jgi:Putative abortive phage resistance protein AbiGi, antitoxin